VLMGDHYHWVVRTPEPNLSEALCWLHVTYSSRFNWEHRLCAVMTSVRQIQRTGRLGWPEVVAAAEPLRGKRRSQMCESWGHWERDGTIHEAVR
jgi:hypothetical protein